MMSSHRVEVVEDSQVGEARRCVAEWCHRLGHDETRCGQGAIIATELARNLVLHGGGGELIIQEAVATDPPGLELLALDQGRGMANVAECMRDGFSTGGTAGTGLGAVKRLADDFEVHSRPGRGTGVWVRFGSGSRASPPAFDVGAVSVALAGEELCGDAWETLGGPDSLRIMVVDGLGHGPFAEEAAREALAVFRRRPQASLTETLELTHQALLKTRGAAGAIVELQPRLNQTSSAAVGNISMRIQLPSGSKSLVSDNGTLGASMRRVQPYTYPWQKDALLVMHSDGLSAQWNLDEYPGLVRRHPSLIAGVLYRDFRRSRDDATVVVVRQHV